MPNIKPVSDLRNYGEVLRDVAIGQPVFLTKNGYGRYAVLDIEEYREYERMRAINRLLEEIERGLQSEKEEAVFTLEEVEESLGIAGEPHA